MKSDQKTPEIHPGKVWSIGWFQGRSPVDLRPDPGSHNPIITLEMITDIDAEFVADPFLLYRQDVWHLFFEILDRRTRRGVIGLSTSSDSRQWTYQGVVLEESFHLSYPHVFTDGAHVFMTPETLEPGKVRLYRARSFPWDWRHEADLIAVRGSDPTVFHFHDHWWMFLGQPFERHDTLRLYHAIALTGPWIEHPRSPVVVDDPSRARPAGRVISTDGRLFRVAQDCIPAYGSAIRAFEIVELTESTYFERPMTPEVILRRGDQPWMSGRVHHLDAVEVVTGQWVAVVDGTAPLP